MWEEVALLGFNALSQTLNRHRDQLAWTEDSESHTEADTCIFETFLELALKIWWKLLSLECKAYTRHPVAYCSEKMKDNFLSCFQK